MGTLAVFILIEIVPFLIVADQTYIHVFMIKNDSFG